MKKQKKRKQTKNRKLRQRNDTKKGKGKSVPITPVASKILERQRGLFISKFGREPGPDDPLIFDRNKGAPQSVSVKSLAAAQSQLVDLLESQGVHPAPCHAARICDFIVTTQSIHFVDDSQVTDWENAIRDWEKKSGEEATEMYIPHELIETLANAVLEVY